MRTFVFNSFIFFLSLFSLVGCGPNTTSRQKEQSTRANSKKNPIEKLAGDTDVVPTAEALNRGRVLMSYSDCFTCHKETDRKRGPAFNDIAARYPMNSTYIRILAKRVILGTRGAWGNVVMPPHPTLSEEDAQEVVMYILSLDGLD